MRGGVHLTGVFNAMQAEIRHMRANGGGAIVTVASTIGARMRLPNVGAYAVTKAGVSALTRVAALEEISNGIRINAISPGPVDTSMTLLPGETEAERTERVAGALPIGHVATPDEIAAAVLWLASSEASFTAGHDLVVDGAATA
jgi:NAD(P)-dependent dehydrogenase (short-subunit alcohol dehydrogenase family)